MDKLLIKIPSSLFLSGSAKRLKCLSLPVKDGTMLLKALTKMPNIKLLPYTSSAPLKKMWLSV